MFRQGLVGFASKTGDARFNGSGEARVLDRRAVQFLIDFGYCLRIKFKHRYKLVGRAR